MSNKINIILVEDDPDQEADLANEIRAALRRISKDADPIIDVFTCEAEFLDQFEEKPEKWPDLFVIDLMLEWRQPWVNSKRELPSPPPEMDEAGVRCLRAIRKHSRTAPVLIWSMTNKELPKGIVDDTAAFHLRKDRAIDGDLESILRRFKLPA